MSVAQLPIEVGEVLAGKYRIDRLLGRGGMGIVLAATHLNLDEKVAIKFLLPKALDDARRVTRFMREARAAAKLRNEHVARVFDVDEYEGAPYIVMEFLPGADLAALVAREGPLEVERACEYILQACEAMAAAHALGIVHRDIKPANLLCTKRQDGSDLIKVIDFGISKFKEPARLDEEEGDGITATAAMLGSPRYMAPEQMQSAKHVDARADVWALGGTLFMLLTGKPPFGGNTVMAVYESMKSGPPAAVKTRSDIPEGVERIVQRALQVDVDDRYRDVGAMARDLAEHAPEHARLHAERATRLLQHLQQEETADEQPQIDGGKTEDPTSLAALAPNEPNRKPWLLFAALVSVVGIVALVAFSQGDTSGAAASAEPRVEASTVAPIVSLLVADGVATSDAPVASASADVSSALPTASQERQAPQPVPAAVASAPPVPVEPAAPTPALQKGRPDKDLFKDPR